MTLEERRRQAAQILGSAGGRKKKNYSPEERNRRREALKLARARRWADRCVPVTFAPPEAAFPVSPEIMSQIKIDTDWCL